MGYKKCVLLLEKIKDQGLTPENKKQIDKEIENYNKKNNKGEIF